MVGTRPEVIKMAPIIRRLRGSHRLAVHVLTIGQHVELLERALADFGITADTHLKIDRTPSSSLNNLLSGILDSIDGVIRRIGPACVIAQGDTTTVAAGGMAAFQLRVPFVHVEAGLRTGDMTAPFPEEFNRRVVSLATTLHCAPTAGAAANLAREGFAAADCLLSGNTVIDALLECAASNPALPSDFPLAPRPVLVTAHRRENAGKSLADAFMALREIADRFADVAIYFPVHPNPATRGTARAILADHPRIVLTEPLGYRDLVAALQHSWLVITDSGGLQEEAPALGKPVLVLRDVTERPEAVDSGAVRLVGTDTSVIVQAVTELHADAARYGAMARPSFPYGDGKAAARIIAEIEHLCGVGSAKPSESMNKVRLHA